MACPAILSMYRQIRDTIADIYAAADRTEAHVARLPIYGEHDRLLTAFEELQQLARHVKHLEAALQSCAAAVATSTDAVATRIRPAADRRGEARASPAELVSQV
jgi:hypothetical protein